MEIDLSHVTVGATKPNQKIARMLAELGIRITTISEDEGNVDRGACLRGVLATVEPSTLKTRHDVEVRCVPRDRVIRYLKKLRDPRRAGRGK